jgi:arylsulfatase A-like enzyme
VWSGFIFFYSKMITMVAMNRPKINVYLFFGMLAAAMTGLVDVGLAAIGDEQSLGLVGWLVVSSAAVLALVPFGAIFGLMLHVVVLVFTSDNRLARLHSKRGFYSVAAAFVTGAVVAVIIAGYMRGIQVDAINFKPLFSLLAGLVVLVGGLYFLGSHLLGRAGMLASCFLIAALAGGGLSIGVLGEHGQALSILITRSTILGPVFKVVRAGFDEDKDGFATWLCAADCDCDDLRQGVNPQAIDIPDNGIDEDCSGDDFKSPAMVAISPTDLSTKNSFDAGLVKAPRNIVLVTVDALRADHMHSYGYSRRTTPGLDQFAQENTLFVQARSSGPSTRFSLPVILTGRYFSGLALEKGKKWYRLLGENVTFAERLKQRGYKTFAVLPYFRFKERSGFSQGFDGWETRLTDSRNPVWDPMADLVTDRGLKHLDSMSSKDGPWFMWLHYFDPHGAYLVHEDQLSFGDERVDRYDGEILYTDRHIQRLFEGMRTRGLWEDTAIIITSDHGEAHGRDIDHGETYHGFSLFDSEVRVPLLVRLPGAKSRKVCQAVGVIDVPATIIELAGIDNAEGVHGISLLPYVLGDSPKRPPLLAQLPGDNPFESVVDWPYKLIWKIRPNQYSLYNLENDPNEQRDVASDNPEDLSRLKDVLRLLRYQSRQ